MKMTTAQFQLIREYNKAVEGNKVLDVSGITEKGTGTRGHAPLKTDKGTKKGVAEFPSVISDNYAAYALAMNMFGPVNVPNGARYAAEFNRMYGGAKIMRAVAVQGVQSPKGRKSPKSPKSPRRVYSGPTTQVQMPGGDYVTVRTPRRSPKVQAVSAVGLVATNVYIPPRSPSPLRGSGGGLIRTSSPRSSAGRVPSPRSSAGRAPSPQPLTQLTQFPRRPQAPILPSGTRLTSSTTMSSPFSVPTLPRSSSPNRLIVPSVRTTF